MRAATRNQLCCCRTATRMPRFVQACSTGARIRHAERPQRPCHQRPSVRRVRACSSLLARAAHPTCQQAARLQLPEIRAATRTSPSARAPALPSTRDLRARALHELCAVLDGPYRASGKKLQATVYEDLLVAARLRDGCGLDWAAGGRGGGEGGWGESPVAQVPPGQRVPTQRWGGRPASPSRPHAQLQLPHAPHTQRPATAQQAPC